MLPLCADAALCNVDRHPIPERRRGWTVTVDAHEMRAFGPTVRAQLKDTIMNTTEQSETAYRKNAIRGVSRINKDPMNKWADIFNLHNNMLAEEQGDAMLSLVDDRFFDMIRWRAREHYTDCIQSFQFPNLSLDDGFTNLQVRKLETNNGSAYICWLIIWCHTITAFLCSLHVKPIAASMVAAKQRNYYYYFSH